MQNCFLPGGSLAVKDGEQVVPVINRIAKGFANVVMTQDWHTAGHVSFASAHAGKKPFETVDLPYGKQVLWPDHCVQGTDGASLSKDLAIPQAGLVIRKGFHKDVDSYSAFTEADGKTTTGLAAYLKARKVKRVFLAGLATDFCVAWTALDARKAGFETYVIEDACRGIDTQGSLAKAWADMTKAGVKRIQSGDIAVSGLMRARTALRRSSSLRSRDAASRRMKAEMRSRASWFETALARLLTMRVAQLFVLLARRGLRAALGDADQRRAQHALADHEAGLHDLDHRACRHRRVGHFVHRLLEVRIELLARRIELLDAVLLQRVEQRALGQLDALDEAP